VRELTIRANLNFWTPESVVILGLDGSFTGIDTMLYAVKEVTEMYTYGFEIRRPRPLGARHAHRRLTAGGRGGWSVL
jgi:hypothetical protein